MKKIFKLIAIFAKLGLLMLGNISSMLPILEEELVKKNKLCTKEDLLDALALGRCGPGAAVVNTITFLGNKIKGFFGGFLATMSFCFFPFIIIICVSLCIDNFLQNSLIISAFKAISVSISVMIIKSIYDLAKETLTNKMEICVFYVTMILSIFTNCSSIIYIVGAILIGIIISRIQKYKFRKNEL